MMPLPTKALSVRQPWAWAIIHGGKDIENRVALAITMGGMERGRICIHASKGMTRDEYESASNFMEKLGVACPRPEELVRGAIIGVVTVLDIVKESTSPWFFGPRGLVLMSPEPVDPVPASGQLGYFEWLPGGELAPALPWMLAWPGGRKASGRLTEPPMPLFATPHGGEKP